MDASSRIRVMVSSRSEVPVFGGRLKLTKVRRNLKAYVQGIRWQSAGGPAGADEPLFEVWIHEDETDVAGDLSTFQISLREIAAADIVLVLYTGHAGSAEPGAPLGICHAEAHEAMMHRPEGVRFVRLEPVAEAATELDRAFQAFFTPLSRFARAAGSESELHAVVAELLQAAVGRLAKRAAHASARSLDQGEALQWGKLNLAARRQHMRDALARVLEAEALPAGAHRVLLAGEAMLVRLDAIPAAASVAAARELVGQPFLRDHQLVAAMQGEPLPGPVHVIACHRGITELQAAAMLGTPDAIVIASDFGIYAADHVHKTQIFFLKKCADENSIRVAVRYLQEWLVQSGEGDAVVERAHSRGRIVAAIAAEAAMALPSATRGKGGSRLRRA